ncbi:MAG: LysR substrate-binding domain-containing protein [Tabrizicola sp.]|jgi:LysR family glycine cleavage system transcriptional activator|nr:LysR substrate-binding domain-containing protein [Tabrizicola sp.]
MYGDLPPLTWLRAFEVSARLLSFTAAANELHLTQAAVSKHVKSLEHRLRHQLFIRHPRSLELTKWGEAYLPKVQDALERLAIGTREVFGRLKDDLLTIRCAVSFAVNWLSPRVPRFLAKHPEVRMRILSSVWVDPFDAEAFDLDIQYGTGTFPDTKSHRLTREVITPLCAPGLVSDLKSPDDLASHTLLHVQGYQEGWGTWLSAAGATRVDPGQGIQTDTSLTAYALACENAGVALGRRSLAAPYRTSGRLVAPFALEVPINEGFFLLEPVTTPSGPVVQSFVDWVLGEAAISA